jgi:hypothetical protein
LLFIVMADENANEGAEQQPDAQEDHGDDQWTQLQQQAALPVADAEPQQASAGGAAGATAASASDAARELSTKLAQRDARLIANAGGMITVNGEDFTVDDNCEDNIDGIFSHRGRVYYAAAVQQLAGEGCSEDVQCILSRMTMDEIKEAAERTKTALPQFIAILALAPGVLQEYIALADAADAATALDLIALLDLVISDGGVTAEDVGSPSTSRELEARIAQLHRGHRFLQGGQQRNNRARRAPRGQAGEQWQYHAPFGSSTGGPTPATAETNATSLGIFAEAVHGASAYTHLTTRDAKTIEDAIDDNGRCNFSPESMNLLLACGSEVQKFKVVVVNPLTEELKDYAPRITTAIVVKMIKGGLSSSDYYILGNTTKDTADYRAMSNVLTVFARAEATTGFKFWLGVRTLGDTICTTVAQYEGDDLISANWAPLFEQFLKEFKKRELARVAARLTGRDSSTDYSTLLNEAGFKLELGAQLTACRTLQLWNAAGKRAAPAIAQPAKSPSLCFSFAQSGTCAFGAGCRFSHVATPSQAAIPAPGGNKDICRDFIRGRCTRGAACRFSH